MTTIDQLDVDLLAALAHDPRTPASELAHIVGVSRNTVQARLARLRDSQLVAGYTPRIDLAALGILVEAFVDIELAQGSLQRVIDALRTLPSVLEIHAVTGRGDLLVRVATTTREQLQTLLQEILAIRGVRRTTTNIALTTPLGFRVSPLLRQLAGARWPTTGM